VAEVTVHDDETYDEYLRRSAPVQERYGAKLLVHACTDPGEVLA
jgi:uncharacterized protein (DUF1330 family)